MEVIAGACDWVKYGKGKYFGLGMGLGGGTRVEEE